MRPSAQARALQHGFRIGALHQIDPSINSVTGPEGVTRLEPKIMQVLVCLAASAGHVVPKDRLMRTVWPDTFVGDDVLTRAISELRRLFGDDVKEPRFIQTIPKGGYRLIAEVVPLVDETLESQEQDAGPEPVAARQYGASDRGRTMRSAAWAIGVLAIILVGFVVWSSRSSVARVSSATSVAALRTMPLTSLPGQETAPTFSPDGNQVAFVWDGDAGNEDIYVQVVGAGTPLRLTTSRASDRNPAWSPDGRYIAFIRVSAEERAIFLIPALGGSKRRLIPLNWESHWDLYGGGLAWSPDGQSLVVSDRATIQDPGTLFALSVDQLTKRPLTSLPPGNYRDVAPAVSPDGKTVAFLRVTSGGVSDVYVVPFAGGQPQRLTFDGAWLERVAWSPDGRDLVYSSGGALGSGTLWKVSASGGKPERLLIGSDNATYPTISARAHRLAFVHRSTDANIWQVPLRKFPSGISVHRPTLPWLRKRVLGSLHRHDTRRARSSHLTGSGLPFTPIVLVHSRSGCAMRPVTIRCS